MKLVDANVLIYAVNESDARHQVCRNWLQRALNGTETIAFTWLALLAFVRLTTHPNVFPQPLAIADATALVREWLARPPTVVLEPAAGHAEALGALLEEAGTAGSLVNDAHLAAIAIAHDAEIVTYDVDFARFRGVTFGPPTG